MDRFLNIKIKLVDSYNSYKSKHQSLLHEISEGCELKRTGNTNMKLMYSWPIQDLRFKFLMLSQKNCKGYLTFFSFRLQKPESMYPSYRIQHVLQHTDSLQIIVKQGIVPRERRMSSECEALPRTVQGQNPLLPVHTALLQ